MRCYRYPTQEKRSHFQDDTNDGILSGANIHNADVLGNVTNANRPSDNMSERIQCKYLNDDVFLILI